MTLVLAVVVLGAGTFALRLAGPVLRARVEPSPRVERLLAVSVAVLFAALVATATLLSCSRWPRPRPAFGCWDCPEGTPSGQRGRESPIGPQLTGSVVQGRIRR